MSKAKKLVAVKGCSCSRLVEKTIGEGDNAEKRQVAEAVRLSPGMEITGKLNLMPEKVQKLVRMGAVVDASTLEGAAAAEAATKAAQREADRLSGKSKDPSVVPQKAAERMPERKIAHSK